MIRVSRTALDGHWRRVRGSTVSAEKTRALVGLTGRFGDIASDATTVHAINSWVNNNVAYVSDQRLYGKADHWAPAKATLSSRQGDCEDFAILKMQMLRALGIYSSNLHLTIARDLARQEDHAVLIVTIGSKKLVLDNATDNILDAAETSDYRPVLSFAATGKWLHGY